MKALALLLAGVVLTGCEAGSGSTTTPEVPPQHTPSSFPAPLSGSPTTSVTETSVAHHVVDLLSRTGGGGSVERAATRVRRPRDAAAYARRFSGDLAEEVRLAGIRGTRSGQPVYAQVVAVGCDTPTRVEVARHGGGVTIIAVPVPSPRPECFAPVTTVAVVTLS